jgi:predicted amidohydrolase YtcJ
MHCNGDATADMFIENQKKYFELVEAKEIRSVVIHAQFSRQDQLKKYKELNLIPSFFSNHSYYWGDVHRKNLGDERARYLSPMKDAHDIGLIFTNHTDYTVTSLDQMFLLWTAVNRLTRTGYVLGEEQGINPYQGLRAITYNAAYQYGEEKTKGSLEAGKLSDLVILDRNPLKVAPVDIKNIKVLSTIKNGVEIYKSHETKNAH